MKYLFFAAAALLLFTIYFHNVIEFDQDLGRHLLMGKIILETHSVPSTNLLSHTYTNYPFINSHWLSEVIFYLIGVGNLLYFKVAIMLMSAMLVLYTAYKYSKNLVATALTFAIFVPVLLERTEIRPEIFSYLFIAIFMYVLLLKPKLLWLLPILQIFWVNLHIYFILGPALVFMFRRFSKISIFVFLATLINPNFLVGAVYPLTVFSNYGYSVIENQNIFFLQQVTNNPNILYFEIAAVLFIVSCFFNKFSWLALFLVLPAWHIRSFPLLFLILLPVFAANLARFTSKYIVPTVIIFTLVFSYHQITSDRFGSKVVESYKGAADYFLANKLQGPIFNNFDIGSYLDYRFYPKEKVFVDGRPEAYPKEFFQNLYIPMQLSAANFAIVDGLYKFNTIIFSRTDGTPWGQQFLTDIPNNPKFKQVYLDDSIVIFSRT